MQDVMIGTLQIAYQLVGEGPPLELLHGGCGLSSTVWSYQLAGLADEFTVVAWDMPGCGKSTDPPEAFRASDYAECLAEFIEALGLERPCLLGHSFGGALALEFYLRIHRPKCTHPGLRYCWMGWFSASRDSRDNV